MKKWITVMLIASAICQIEADKFMRCELVNKLIELNFDRSYLNIWDCLIEKISERDTSKVSTLPNNSKSYGLFQINSKEWCYIGRPGGICNMKCENFLNKDLTDDAQCALEIQNKRGFDYWPAYSHCSNTQNRPNIHQICNPRKSIRA